MARFAVVCCLVLLVGSSAKQRKLLLELLQSREGRSFARPISDAAQATLLALDKDHSGKVERRELEVFAKAEGLSIEDVDSEFGQLDTDGDGELSATEIMGTLEAESDLQVVKTGTEAPVAQIASPVAAAPILVTRQSTDSNSRQASLRLDATDKTALTPTASITSSANDVALQAPLTFDSGALADIKGSSYNVGEDILNEHVMMQKVKHDVRNVLAVTFARSLGSTLQNETLLEKNAQEMEASALLLRQRAESLVEGAQEETLNAASQAASKILEAARSRVHDFDMRAQYYDSQAARHHQQALTAMDKIVFAQSQMRTSMTPV